jgi:hypothetical protein
MHDSTASAGFIRLLLLNFCPDDTLSAINNRTITIIYAELADLLVKVEREENIAEAPFSPSFSKKNVPFVSKRKRLPTPKLTLEDETAFE